MIKSNVLLTRITKVLVNDIGFTSLPNIQYMCRAKYPEKVKSHFECCLGKSLTVTIFVTAYSSYGSHDYNKAFF